MYVMKQSLDVLELSHRADRTVRELGCETVRDVLHLTYDDLVNHPQCGAGTLNEVLNMGDEIDREIIDRMRDDPDPHVPRTCPRSGRPKGEGNLPQRG